jgi:3-isopropylmalate/(R)-2-methylmalate dehydratase large subunit
LPVLDPNGAAQLADEKNADFGSALQSHDDHQGIVHVIGPEQGLTQPGMTIVCDSHTATPGFGALAFGIGTSQVGHVLACSVAAATFEILRDSCRRQLEAGVAAKDIILAVIAKIGIGGGTESVFEFTGRLFAACRWKNA